MPNPTDEFTEDAELRQQADDIHAAIPEWPGDEEADDE